MSSATRMLYGMLGALCLAAMVAQTGCAAGKAFDRGQQQMAQGRYDAAVTAFQEAVERSPSKPEYQTALRQAREFAGRAHLDLASAAVESRDLATAQREARTAWSFAPTDPAKALLARITQDQGDARGQRDAALQLAAGKSWDEALAALAKAMAMDRSLPGAAADGQRIKDSAARDFTTRGAAALEAGDLTAAEANARQALAYVPNHSGARDIFQTISNRREAARLLESARTQMQQGRYPEALAQLLTANDLQRDHSAITAALTETRTAIARQFAQQFSRSVQAQQWGQALIAGLLANDYTPGTLAPADVGANAQRIRQRITFRLAVAGIAPADEKTRTAATALAGSLTERLLAGKPEHALLLDRAALDKIAAENKINQDLTDPQSAVLAGKLARVDALMFGQILEAAVTTTAEHSTGISQFQSGTQWVTNPPYPAVVAARDEAAHHLDEAEHRVQDCRLRLREIEKLPPPSPGAGAPPGADAPRPSREARDRSDDPQGPTDQQRAEERKRLEEQARQEARKRGEMRERAEHELAEAVDVLKQCAVALHDAQVQLDRTPSLIRVPVISDFQFPIDTVTRRGTLRLKLQAIDPATGEVLHLQTLDGGFSASDRTIQADPLHNVPGDALELPDDATVWARTLADVTQKLSGPAAAVAGLQAQKLIAQARREQKASQNDAAIEHYLDFLFAAPASAPERSEALAAVAALAPHDERLAPLGSELRKLLPGK